MLEVLVANLSILKCSQGTIPSSLTIPPDNSVNLVTTGFPIATAAHHLPLVNILPFSMCKSWYNPTVLAAGLNLKPKPLIPFVDEPIPQPCIPMTFEKWEDGSKTTTVKGQSAVTMTSKCKCLWQGEITPVISSQFIVQAL